MAQLEVRDAQGIRSLVELGNEPLIIGFDAAGAAAWGPGVAVRAAEIHGDVLRTEDGERSLEPGAQVTVAGLQLTLLGAQDAGAALNEIGKLLWTVEHPEQLFDRVLDAALRVLHITRATLALLDDDEDLALRATRGKGLVLNPTITRAALESGAAILTSEAAVKDESADELSIDVRSILCAPMRDEGRPLGVLYADNDGRANSFSNEELDFASALAHLASFALNNLTRTEQLLEENTLLKRQLGLGANAVHASASMEDVLKKVEKVAGFDATVLITGESGVGKEVVAREIHARSPRGEGKFIAVNCAAIPDTLLESELFGYAPQSAIAGADPKGRAGKFEQAEGGSIFLDEIGELKPELQAKLLRVLQDKKVDRINDTVSRDIDVRIVVATNQQLEQLVREGRFREDLYYRLNVVAIDVPPLRKRRDDIPVLTEFFIRTYPGPEELRKVTPTRAVVNALGAYAWPGNVRELKNCIEQALILGDGQSIRLADLPEPIRRAAKSTTDAEGELPPLADIEKAHIARVLAATGWNKAKSSRILGISKPTLYDKIRNYGLAP